MLFGCASLAGDPASNAYVTVRWQMRVNSRYMATSISTVRMKRVVGSRQGILSLQKNVGISRTNRCLACLVTFIP